MVSKDPFLCKKGFSKVPSKVLVAQGRPATCLGGAVGVGEGKDLLSLLLKGQKKKVTETITECTLRYRHLCQKGGIAGSTSQEVYAEATTHNSTILNWGSVMTDPPLNNQDHADDKTKTGILFSHTVCFGERELLGPGPFLAFCPDLLRLFPPAPGLTF